MSIELSIPVLFSYIKPFNGEKDELHKFTRNCDIAYNLATTAQKYVIFTYIQSQVSGKADRVTSHREFEDWPEYKKILIENFAEEKDGSQLILELQSCRQYKNESVIEFTQRVEKAYSHLYRSTLAETTDKSEIKGKIAMVQKMALQAFNLGVLPQYGFILRARNPATFEEASVLVQNEEKIISLIRFSQNNNTEKICNTCKKSGHNSINCYKNKNKNHHYESKFRYDNKIKNEPIFQTYTNHDRNHQNSSKICNYCKKPGHLIADCYSLQNNKKKRNFNPKFTDCNKNPFYNKTNNRNNENNHLNSNHPHGSATIEDVKIIRAGYYL